MTNKKSAAHSFTFKFIKMKKRIILLVTLIAIVSSNFVNAQTIEPQKNQVNNKTFIAELGGAGILFSANFDSRFKATERLGWGYRIGLGFTNTNTREYYGTGLYDYNTIRKTPVTIPLGVNYLFGKSNSDKIFEVGAGVTIFPAKISIQNVSNRWGDEYKQGNLIGHFTFMYRKQPIDGGYTWRIGFTPLIGTDGQIIFSAGVGLGYCFP